MIGLITKTIIRVTGLIVLIVGVVLGIAYILDFKTATSTMQENINNYLEHKEKAVPQNHLEIPKTNPSLVPPSVPRGC